jgi:hypothetical protein
MTLNLGDNPIRDEGFQHLANALDTNTVNNIFSSF